MTQMTWNCGTNFVTSEALLNCVPMLLLHTDKLNNISPEEEILLIGNLEKKKKNEFSKTIAQE